LPKDTAANTDASAPLSPLMVRLGEPVVMPHTLNFTCPRCEYDLRGQHEAHATVLQGADNGTCAECGLAFVWSEVLTRDARLLRGFVEHTTGVWGTFVAAWRTWWWVLRPWSFWSKVSLERPLRVPRLWIWLVLLLMPLRLVMTALAAIVAWGMATGVWGSGRFSKAAAWEMAWLGVLEGILVRRWNGVELALSDWPPTILTLAAAWCATGLMLFAIPFTLGAARVHNGHVVRALVYSLGCLVPFVVLNSVKGILDGLKVVFSGAAYVDLRVLAEAGLEGLSFAAAAWPYWSLLCVGWFGAYWWYALRRGWRLERPRKIWATLMLAALLAGISAFLMQDEGGRFAYRLMF